MHISNLYTVYSDKLIDPQYVVAQTKESAIEKVAQAYCIDPLSIHAEYNREVGY